MRSLISVLVILLATQMQCCATSVGMKAPDFTMPDLNGVNHSLSAYQGEVVLLDFWATWCQPCVVTSPVVQDLHDRFSPRGLQVFAVHYNDVGDPATYMQEHGYTYTVLPDANAVCKQFGVSQIPTFIIVGVDGTVIHRQTGYAVGDDEKMAAIIERDLAPRS